MSRQPKSVKLKSKFKCPQWTNKILILLLSYFLSLIIYRYVPGWVVQITQIIQTKQTTQTNHYMSIPCTLELSPLLPGYCRDQSACLISHNDTIVMLVTAKLNYQTSYFSYSLNDADTLMEFLNNYLESRYWCEASVLDVDHVYIHGLVQKTVWSN